MNKFDIPILVIIFNRPENSVEVINSLRRIKPSKIYISADGPRYDKNNDKRLCELTQESVVKAIDWPCELKTKFHVDNLGCGEHVNSAISWAFKYEEKLIILEDDIIASKQFFPYCEELLERYKSDERVWLISGLNHFDGKMNLNADSYFFSHYAAIWGWATWRDRWKKFDLHMSKWEKWRSSNFRFSHVSMEESNHRFNVLNRYYETKVKPGEKLDSWATPFCFPIWSNSGVGIVPSENLISNIGSEGTHSNSKNEIVHFKKTSETYSINQHPMFFQTNHKFDDFYFTTFSKRKKLMNRIINKLKRTFNKR